jgi:hypothetical protein
MKFTGVDFMKHLTIGLIAVSFGLSVIDAFATINQDITLRDDCDGQCHTYNIYVDDAGNDSMGTGLPNGPFATITKGASKLGDQSSSDNSVTIRTVCVDNGSYNEEVSIGSTESGTSTQYYMVQATSAANLANPASISSSNTAVVDGGFLLDGGAQHFAINGFAITDTVEEDGDEKGQAIRIEGPNDTSGDPLEEFYIIDNYIFETIGSGVAIWGADWKDNPGNFDNLAGIVVRGNYFHNVIDGGSNEKLHAAVGVSDVWFYKNTFVDDVELDINHGGECIDFKDGVKDGYIVGNDLTECGKNNGLGPNAVRRTNIYVDGGRTAWNNARDLFVDQNYRCPDNTGATCPIYNHGTPTNLNDDVLLWTLDAVALNENITISGNRLRDGTGNGISVTTEGFGSNDDIFIFNNTVKNGDSGGIVVHDADRGKEAYQMCAAASTTCGRTLGVDVYNNTVSGTPQLNPYQKSFMYNSNHATGVVRANISANVTSGINAGHYQQSGTSSPTLSHNVCDTSNTNATFCASSESPTTMNLNSNLKPASGSAAVNRSGLTVYPAKDIDGITRYQGSAPDAGAHEQ